jgi:hypothetical protein
LVIDTVVCLTLAKWETVSGQFGGYLMNSQTFTAPAGGFLAGDTFTTSNPNVQMVKVGANYLFKYGVGGY